MDLGIKDKVALVTAASKGLGRAAALELALQGARLSICARSQALEDAAERIYARSAIRPLTTRADVTRQEDIDLVVERTLERFGRIDILVINAGGPPPGNFLSLTPEDWEAASTLTLMSAVRLCYSVVPQMIEQGDGSIVAIQSYSVKQPIDNLILSNSIRMAVIGMLKSLANEVGPKGVRVNSINPAWTWTERVEQLMQDRLARSGASLESENARLAASVPLGRMGTVEEFGRAVTWLASPAASYIHGHALMFDGGATKTAL